MDNIPKIVRQRLKAPLAEANHPQADELTAFAERSLPESERIVVLEHLARCCDCRDILALALPATESTETAFRAPARERATWPAFRWGLVAAGVAMIAVLGIVQHQRGSEHNATSADSPQAVFGEARNQPLASPIAPDAANKTQSPIVSPKVNHSDRQIATQLVRKNRAARAGGAGVPVPNPAPGVGYGAAPAPLYKQHAAGDLAANMQLPATPVGGSVQAQSAPFHQQTAAGRFESSATAPQPSNASADEDYAGDRVGKAKPAVTPQAATAASVPQSISGRTAPALTIPRWTISPAGVLQRSFDDGATWQTVAVEAPGYFTDAMGVDASGKPLQHKVRKIASPTFRAVAATGTDVWAGGTSALLYHSQDAGDHWIRVMPAASGATLNGDIVSLEFLDMQHGKVSTSTAEIWITTDDGQTWQKQ